MTKEIKLEDLMNNVAALEGEHQVSFEELFTDRFMRRNTEFGSIDDFFQKFTEETGHKAKTEEDFAAIPDAELDAFVAKRSRFSTWEDMLGTAGEEYHAHKLGLG